MPRSACPETVRAAGSVAGTAVEIRAPIQKCSALRQSQRKTPECASAVPPCPPMPRVPAKNTAAEIPPPSPASVFGFVPVPQASYLQTLPESPSAPAAQLGLALTQSKAKRPPQYAQRPTPPAIGNKAICRRP